MRASSSALLLLVVCTAVWAAAAVRLRSVRDGLLAASVVVAAYVAVVTELLSLVHGLRPVPLLLVWIAGGVAAVVDLLPRRAELRRLLARTRRSWRWPMTLLALAPVAPFLVGAFSAPNNYDSMTYHLARVAHWADAGSVHFYATAVDRQLWTTPLAEYGILHVYVLGGGDRYAFAVQWASYIVCTVGVTVIARRLGLSGVSQLLAGFLALAIPMGVLQASTTQNDLVAGVFTLVLVALLLAPLPDTRTAAVRWAVLLGLASGAAVLVKPTTAVFVAPFALRWLFLMDRRRLVARFAVLPVAAVAALVVVGPHFARTADLYGSPLGSGAEITNASYGVAPTVENVVRNLALNLGVPIDSVNAHVTQTVVDGLHAVGMDANDPTSTFAGTSFSVIFAIQEDVAGNFAATILLLLALVVVALRRRPRHSAGAYAVCTALSLVLYCAVFAWQPWGNRLLLPWFLLAMVVVAAALDRLSVRLPLRMPMLAPAVLAIVVVLGAEPWFVHSAVRPLIGAGNVFSVPRSEQYYLVRPPYVAPYTAVSQRIVQLRATDVTLVQGLDSWEYPFWEQIRPRLPGFALRSVQVTNDSKQLEDDDVPDAMLCTVPCAEPKGWKVEDYGTGVTLAVPPA